MEFSLDFALVRDILEPEHKRARDELQARGVFRAFESSQQRHDVRIAAAPASYWGTLRCWNRRFEREFGAWLRR